MTYFSYAMDYVITSVGMLGVAFDSHSTSSARWSQGKNLSISAAVAAAAQSPYQSRSSGLGWGGKLLYCLSHPQTQ